MYNFQHLYNDYIFITFIINIITLIIRQENMLVKIL
jgi:hypothetical protein